VTPTRRFLQRALPAVVTATSLGWVATKFDMSAVAAALTPRVFWTLLPALFLYGVATLLLESNSILVLLTRRPEQFGAWTAARIKCASYLLAIVNYALGGAALTVLLARRAELGMGKAAGVVLLISFTDLAVVLTLGAAGLLGQSDTLALHGGLVALGAVMGLSGFALLRYPGSLGRLERLRSLSVFDALRDASFRQLSRLVALRAIFSVCFIGVAAAAFAAFDVSVDPFLLVGGVMALALIGAIPIAVSGLGPGQVAAVAIFRGTAPPETLLALSLVLSAGLIGLRAAMGLIFAREFTKEALEQTREKPAGNGNSQQEPEKGA
jgi:uncharacterized membrane protein YbhN (UPF0104 family)